MGHQTSLMASTTSWLVKLATGSIDTLPTGLIAETESPTALACVPEFVMENLCEHLLLVKRFNSGHFDQFGPKLGSILMMILCYIDLAFLLRNPRLRARLAESLELSSAQS